MSDTSRPITILIADDDPDDRDLVRDALKEICPSAELRAVTNGEELMDYLHHREAFAPPQLTPLPDLILLDLNMPRKSGRETLAEMKAEAGLRRIPVVVLTTSQAEEDISRTYDLGASSFIVKPSRYQALLEIVTTVSTYWFKTVSLPDRG
jgi:CheY-like chemotaxis protein